MQKDLSTYSKMKSIEEITNLKEQSCNCSKCQEMCHRAVCLGTPDDILKLAESGYADKLLVTKWSVKDETNLPPIMMIQLEYDEEKSIYYVYKPGKIELAPSEVRAFEVEVNDVWVVFENTLDDLKKPAKTFGIKDASKILEKVAAAVTLWPKFAQEAGIDSQRMERIKKSHRKFSI